MAIIVKKPIEYAGIEPLYASSLRKARLIVGLGNLGERYQSTYHNLGFICLDAFAQTYQLDWQLKTDFKVAISQMNLINSSLILIKPQTFVNLSGEAVRKTASFYKIDPEQIYVIYDEIRLSFKTIETNISEKDFGHNGLKSIFQSLNLKYLNLIRIGIGPKPAAMDLTNFVLSKIDSQRQIALPKITQEVCNLIGQLNNHPFKNKKQTL